MRELSKYRDAEKARQYSKAIADLTTRPWTIMEVCGGQTHSILRFGLDQLLPPQIKLIHGPGCPVCVTSIELIDKAIQLASMPQVTLCSFGDMLRVPGSEQDLFAVKSAGADVRIVYSPLDALAVARENPDREVVFFAVGFETTAPVNAMAAYQAKEEGLSNFSLLVAHVLVPPAMEYILAAEGNTVQGFLAAGHVCSVTGYQEYHALADKYHVPIVVTGFEPLDILQGIHMCVRQLEQGQARVENQYTRVVKAAGNLSAQQIMEQVFTVVPRRWRGIGTIAASGLGLASAYREFDAEAKFPLATAEKKGDEDCQSGLVLQGRIKPTQCPAFGKRCTPLHPLGAPMVSSEGACAAYYRYRKHGMEEGVAE